MTTSFGIDRLGILAVKFPKTCLLLIALATPFFVNGASNLEFASDIKTMFRSKAPEFATLQRISAEYPTTEHDVEVVVQGANVLAPNALQHLRELTRELSALKSVQRVRSIFDAVRKPELGGTPDPLIPASPEAVQTIESADLLKMANENPLIGGRMLSKDGALTLLSVDLVDEERTMEEASSIVESIRLKARDFEQASGLSAQLTGLAVMRVEIVGALSRDQNIFRLAALAVALAATWLFFRRFIYVVIAGVPAAVAISWLLGSMWYAGQTINVLTNVAPTIVLVIVFSDCVHLLFAIRRNIADGLPLEDAVSEAVRDIGPACVLTSATTILALSSLVIVAHPFIASFGLTAAAGVALALLATLIIVPALSVLLLGNVAASTAREPGVQSALIAASDASATAALAAPRTISAVGLVAAIATAWLYSYNEPRYRYSDNLPTDEPAYKALQAIEAKLGGANTLRVLIDWPANHDMTSPETAEVIREVDQIIQQEPTFEGIASVSRVLQWLGVAETQSLVRLALGRIANSELGQGLIAKNETSAIVTAQFADLPANQLVPVLDRVEAKLAEVEQRRGNVSITASGIATISARASYEMIHELNNSLLLAIGIIIALIGIGFRSLVACVASILPNILPLLAGGLYLYLTGKGLQFTALIAFTIGFGLAVDSTIHMLNRYAIERRKAPNSDLAIRKSLHGVGPVVIVSTVCVTAGLGATLTSQLPMLQLYGAVVIVVLSAAFVADMLLLPALIIAVERLRAK